jgi:hypothetical protein
MGAIMQIFDKNRFLFGFTLSCILGMPSCIAETHLPDTDENKPVIQLERLPEIAARDSDEKKPIATQPESSPEVVPRESDIKSLRDRQRESRKKRAKRAKLKNAILLERSRKKGLAITRRDLQGIEGIKNVITIDPKDNWLIIPLGEEVIVINPSELRLPPPEILRGGNKSVNPTVYIPGVHIPADDLD